ncbi:MAG: hypothetical protein ACHQD9_01330 [Chitinophagales bacterium]
MKTGNVLIKSAVAFSFLWMIALTTFAQSQETTWQSQVTTNVPRINFLGFAGVGYEIGLGKGFTFSPELGLGWPVIQSTTHSDNTITLHVKSAVNPYLLLDGRYYYNFQRRFEAGKPIDHFSGNYVGAFYRYNLYEYVSYTNDETEELLKNVQYFGVWWGLQRNIGEKHLFYFNFSIGPAIKTDLNTTTAFTVAGNLGLGLQW